MTLDMEAKRIAIYFIYDREGIVDDYIIYQLNDLKENVHYLLVVVNGILTAESRKRLAPIANEILARKNEGFDVWAYKAGIEYIGWDNLKEYDELLLMNFTCFGPLYPFKEAFDAMNERDVDFWGMTKYHRVDQNPFDIEYGYIPEHIQSHFLCVRKSMFSDHAFKDYWDSRPVIMSYKDTVGKHEAVFTKKFEDMGFKSDVYVNTEDLREHTDYPLMMSALELVKNRRCPLFKRRNFTQNYDYILSETVGEPTVELIKYIRENTKYDMNMVWDNILRLENMSDIKNCFHLNRVVPRDYPMAQAQVKKRKVALVFHFYFSDLLEEAMTYIKAMPEYADIYVTTGAEGKKVLVEAELEKTRYNYKVILVKNRGRDVSALLVGAADYIFDYEYVCFLHDKKTGQVPPKQVGKSWAYACFENTAASRDFIENVIHTFENEPRLGMLTPPPPHHGIYAREFIGYEWTSNFEMTKKLLDDFDIKTNIDPQKMPVAPFGTMFWFRPEALKPLFKKAWKYEDFPEERQGMFDGTILHAIERGYPFFVQAAGFYAAWLMNDKFAAIALTNYHYMLRELKFENERLQNGINWHNDMKAKQAYIEELTAKIACLTAENETVQSGIDWHIDDMKAKQVYIEELTAKIACLTTENETLQSGIDWHIDNMKAKQVYIEELQNKIAKEGNKT